MTTPEIKHLLFEIEAHRLLDVIGAPKSPFVNVRLREYAKQIGKNPEPKPKAKKP